MSNFSFLSFKLRVVKKDYFSMPLTLLPHNLCSQNQVHMYLICDLAIFPLKHPALQHPNFHFFSFQEKHHHHHQHLHHQCQHPL